MFFIKTPSHILVYRFSAIGDVAMVAAVLREYAQHYPHVKFTMVSQAFLKPLFEGFENVHFVAVETNGKHKGFPGLWRLFRELRALRPDVFADMHHVLRSMVVRTFFFFSGTPVCFLKKGRREKRRLTRRRHKQLQPLKSMFRRYEQVLQKALRAPSDSIIDSLPLIAPKKEAGTIKKIGIAPFAKHEGKCYPLGKMEEVVAHFAMQPDVEIYLFGGGKEEALALAEWEARYVSVTSMAGKKLSLAEELEFMKQLTVMVSMDSANMHFASFVEVPVISVWGATHPYVGFYGWRQNPENAVQIDLYCRPCSVFGNKPCYRGDYACMNTLNPGQIIQKISAFLKS